MMGWVIAAFLFGLICGAVGAAALMGVADAIEADSTKNGGPR